MEYARPTLSAAGQVRIVIPTVYRNNYLVGLSAASNGVGHGETIVSVLAFAQKWSSTVDWTDYDQADAQVKDSNAYLDAGLAERSGGRRYGDRLLARCRKAAIACPVTGARGWKPPSP